ncbi:MAG: hypothetical protein AAF490_16160 [Chloroflexota bacterium]
MTNQVPSSATLHVNPEHGGLRAVIVFSLIISAILGFAFIRQILGIINDGFPDYTVIVSCFGGLFISLITIWVVERILKRTWHSGQKIELDEKGITLVNRVENDLPLKWNGDISGRHWTFGMAGYNRVARENRLPKNWLCLASMIQDGDKRLVVYTYLSPDKREDFLNGTAGNLAYHTIDPKEVFESSMRLRVGPTFYPAIPASILTGPNGRYWLAEKRRWEHGLELSIEDYEMFVTFVSHYLTEQEIKE